MSEKAVSKFRHKSPPVPVQYLIGFFMHGVMRVLIKGAEKIGKAGTLLAKRGASMRARQEKRNPFRQFTPGPQDIFVMTYAKSGTNWMMQIAHQLIYHAQGEFDHIHDVVPWPDTEVMPGFMGRYAIPWREANHWLDSPEKQRVIKTHFNWEMLPYSAEARYIAVIRDPKDVFVSNYFFVKDSALGPSMPTVDTWYKLFLSKDFIVGGSWAENAAGYWAQRHRPNVMVVSFKSMKKDLRGTVIRVAEFLGIRVSDAIIDEVCRLASFQHMKSIDHKFSIGKLTPWREGGAMIRKGSQGGSSELLSPERQREMDAYFMQELRELGSDFPYEEFCEVTRETVAS